MVDVEAPSCDSGHPTVEMGFVESYDPIATPDDGSTEWRERWRYACGECGRVVDLIEAADGTVDRVTVRESTDDVSRDPTSLSPTG